MAVAAYNVHNHIQAPLSPDFEQIFKTIKNEM